MTMTMTTDSIAVILACPAPRLDWRSKIPWPQREPVALSKWTEVRNAKTTSAKKVPNIQEPAPQTASSTHFQVFRCFPDMSNLHQSSAFPNLQVLSSAPPPHTLGSPPPGPSAPPRRSSAPLPATWPRRATSAVTAMRPRWSHGLGDPW